MKRVFVCSPYRGDVTANVALARAACHEVLRSGDAPFAPHLLYPDLLDDQDAAERERGIAAGLTWLAVSDAVLVVGEPTEGMRREIAAAEALGLPVRRLPESAVSGVAPAAPSAGRLRDFVAGAWADRWTLLALLLVVLGLLLLPGCVAPACEGCCPTPTRR